MVPVYREDGSGSWGKLTFGFVCNHREVRCQVVSEKKRSLSLEVIRAAFKFVLFPPLRARRFHRMEATSFWGGIARADPAGEQEQGGAQGAGTKSPRGRCSRAAFLIGLVSRVRGCAAPFLAFCKKT